MNKPALTSRLQWRIWLAVVAAVVLTTILVSLLMSSLQNGMRQPRHMQIRNAQGQVIGYAQIQARKPGRELVVPVETADGQKLQIELLPPGMVPEPASATALAPAPAPAKKTNKNNKVKKRGKEKPPVETMPLRFGERTEDAATKSRILLPRGPLGIFLLLSVLALAIGLGAYPVTRRMTKRLEKLQSTVERWGQGEFDVRADIAGDDEVAHLGVYFNEAATRIEALLKSHQNMLANTSHELRTPLARLRMAIELLGSKPITLKNRIEIERNVRELDDLVEEILLHSRLDARMEQSPEQHKTHVDLIGLAAQECARYGVSLRTSMQQAEVWGQEKLLQRLMRNLLQNAKRYGGQTPETLAADDFGPSMPVTLEAESEHAMEMQIKRAPKSNDFYIEVLDRGPGVPEAYREKIFEAFFRLPSAAEHEGGAGLGLALVRSIAAHHGGSVVCLARPGGGSCFRVTLPQWTPI